MTKFNLSEIDVFYLSYDEPYKEEFWSRIRNKVEWAENVDGVKGFDAAHKECARRSYTDWFITIDGDNDVDETFFSHDIEIPDRYQDYVLSWAGQNMVNNLVYGNGGIKLWPKSVVENMNTHECATDESSKLDFCWTLNYLQMKNSYSWTHPNGSPEQAFRAGYREGVKMTLDHGTQIAPEELMTRVPLLNRKRLQVWCSVGMDAEYGVWCMHGARRGLCDTFNNDIDISIIADYDLFAEQVWKPIKKEFELSDTMDGYKWNHPWLLYYMGKSGDRIKAETGLPVAILDESQSLFFKSIHDSPPRSRLVFEIDV